MRNETACARDSNPDNGRLLKQSEEVMNQAIKQQLDDIQGMLNAHKQQWITLEQHEIDVLVRKAIELQSVLYTN